MVKVREIPTTIKHKIIKDEVIRQVNDVDAIIKGLLAQKVQELRAQNPEGLAKEQEQQTNNGLLYNNVVEALDNLKVEMLGNPTTETVRQVKLMLNDVSKNLKGLPTSNVKAILDLIFNFIPYTKTNKTDGELINYNDNNYVQNAGGAKIKNVEIRRLIRDIMLKFVHDNSIKYLREDLYPKTYEEAKQYFNIENIGQQVAQKETADNKARLDKRQKVIDDAHKAEAERLAKIARTEAERLAEIARVQAEKKAKDKADKDAKFNEYVEEITKFFIENPNALIDYINDKSVCDTITKFIGHPTTLSISKVGTNIEYNNALNKRIQDALSHVTGADAVSQLEIDLQHASDLSVIKAKLNGSSNANTVFNYLINELNPITDLGVLQILKVSNDKALRKSLASKL